LSETKINYWFKHLLNCNISAILVAIIKLIDVFWIPMYVCWYLDLVIIK